jgi:hypothetical protein
LRTTVGANGMGSWAARHSVGVGNGMAAHSVGIIDTVSAEGVDVGAAVCSAASCAKGMDGGASVYSTWGSAKDMSSSSGEVQGKAAAQEKPSVSMLVWVSACWCSSAAAQERRLQTGV